VAAATATRPHERTAQAQEGAKAGLKKKEPRAALCGAAPGENRKTNMQPEDYHAHADTSRVPLLAAGEMFDLAELEFALDEDSHAGCSFGQLGVWILEVALRMPPSLAAAFDLPSPEVGGGRG